jgi:hypothetical protein
MKKTAALIAAATIAFSAPMAVSAAEHGSMHMEMEHGGMMSMGKLIHTQTVDGVKATFRLIDMKERMKGMEMPAGMKDTHHLMVMFTDAKTGKTLSEGEAKVKIAGPDKSEQVKTMMGMEDGFGADVNFSKKGKYGIMTKFKLADGKVRSVKFWYEAK